MVRYQNVTGENYKFGPNMETEDANKNEEKNAQGTFQGCNSIKFFEVTNCNTYTLHDRWGYPGTVNAHLPSESKLGVKEDHNSKKKSNKKFMSIFNTKKKETKANEVTPTDDLEEDQDKLKNYVESIGRESLNAKTSKILNETHGNAATSDEVILKENDVFAYQGQPGTWGRVADTEKKIGHA